MLGYLLLFSAASYLLLLLSLRRNFKLGLRATGLLPIALVAGMMAAFAAGAWPAISKYGLSLFLGVGWDPERGVFGLLPALLGTIITSSLALALAAPLAIGASVLINEVLPRRFKQAFASLMDLAAAVPTVVYGLWGMTSLAPTLQGLLEAFGVYMQQFSLLTAAVLLAIMIVPYAAAIMREGYALVPRPIEEAIYAIGATKLEAVLLKLRYAKNYVVGGLLLALGRAMGETVAVALVVGYNPSRLPTSLLQGGATLSTLIAVEYEGAAQNPLWAGALFSAALLLSIFGLALNFAALFLLTRR
ncbi:MAG: phosphate ABC transporter permease subunit PstC [Thermoproteus sp.]